MKTREWQLAFYIRDRWQVSRKLTINLGLRYEYYPLINRGDRGIERWDPATNIVYFGGLGGHAAECRNHGQPQESSPRAPAWPTASERKACSAPATA